jgi:hypothetical protein
LVVLDPEEQSVFEETSDFTDLAIHWVRLISDLYDRISGQNVIFHIDRDHGFWFVLNFSGDIIDLDIFKLVLRSQNFERLWTGLKNNAQLPVILIQDQLTCKVVNVVHVLLEKLSI